MAKAAESDKRPAEATSSPAASSNAPSPAGPTHYARSLLEASLDPLVTISPQGKITDVNQATEAATGLDRNQLIGSDFSDYFTEPQRAREGYQAVISQGFVRDYELTIRHVSGRTTDVLYNASVYRNEAGQVQGVFAAARDITQRKAAQLRQDVTNTLLSLFARKNSRKEYLDAVVTVLQGWSGCRNLGIRLIDARGHIPYEAHVGFDDEFRAQEGDLCLDSRDCFCARAVAREPLESDLPLLTPAGSFRCDDTAAFAATLTARQLAGYRGLCIRRGFASLAIIPIRYRQETLGAVHLADERKGLLPPDRVEFLEQMAPLIAEAIFRFSTESELGRTREHLEELVEQRTYELEQTATELARSNEDLQQFAYVASHDLQEPLRVVSGFLGLLKERYAAGLDDKALEFIGFAVDGSHRMSELIRDLLEYSRVQSTARAPEPTDLNAVFDRAVANCLASIRESQAQVTRESLPQVNGDAGQLAQLLQNLIGNAVKFRRENVQPQIHVAAQRDGRQWRIQVTDNSIGIPTEQAGHIFQIFQRLHTREKYPGTGIGLAICKKIVERHGGNIWVESTVGQGSTFCFTIPA